MKKRVILTAAIIGALSELAAVIYTIHIRSNAVIGRRVFYTGRSLLWRHTVF